MTTIREIVESPVEQGIDEEIIYTLTTTPYGSSPTSQSVAVYDITSGVYTDVTATVMPTNTPTVSNDIITLSPLKDLTAGSQYRVEVKFTSSGNIFEPYSIINAKR